MEPKVESRAKTVTMLQEALGNLAGRYGLAEIYAFGSRAFEARARVWGDASFPGPPGSDLDIGVWPEPGRYLSVEDKVRIALELEDLFDVPRVDLVVMCEAGPFLALDIVRGELLYCRDLDEQAEHELDVIRRANDLAVFERRRIDAFFSGDRP